MHFYKLCIIYVFSFLGYEYIMEVRNRNLVSFSNEVVHERRVY